MKFLIKILLIFFLCGNIMAQSKKTMDSIIIQKSDTLCNYIVTRNFKSFVLPNNFDFKNNQKGFVLIEITIESEKIKGWKIDVLRIMESDSIIRNYSVYNDKTMPSDIDALKPEFEKIINNISLKPFNKEIIDPTCKIGLKFDLIKQ